MTTPWWFPAKTDAGSIRQDRLVLPIPPQLHWSEPMPVLHPEQQEAPAPRSKAKPAPAASAQPATPTRRPRAHIQAGPPPAEPIASQPALTASPSGPGASPEGKGADPKPPRPKRKADPKLVAAARELRDRWLEKVDAEPDLLLPRGKYDLARALPGPGGTPSLKALPQAA